MFSLASVMYAMRCMVGLPMVGLSRCYGVVHAESSLMSAATDVKVLSGQNPYEPEDLYGGNWTFSMFA